ncbi:MAG: citryl-CoA lyase [Candidatus Eisenbacteria bacterium]
MGWPTRITRIEPNRITVRGQRLDELMGKLSFAEVVYLILRGQLPGEPHRRILDAILVASIDHGVTPPSTVSARTVASCGVPLTAALAAGVLSIGKHHGGAVEDCMKELLAAVKEAREAGVSLEVEARNLVERLKREGRRLAGFGHRIHTQDPRTKKLRELARESGLFGPHLEMTECLEKALKESSGKDLPLNVDGAIAAVLCEMDFPPSVGNAFFVIGRIPGLVAHIYEETTTMKPMRTVVPSEAQYEGK